MDQTFILPHQKIWEDSDDSPNFPLTLSTPTLEVSFGDQL